MLVTHTTSYEKVMHFQQFIFMATSFFRERYSVGRKPAEGWGWLGWGCCNLVGSLDWERSPIRGWAWAGAGKGGKFQIKPIDGSQTRLTYGAIVATILDPWFNVSFLQECDGFNDQEIKSIVEKVLENYSPQLSPIKKLSSRLFKEQKTVGELGHSLLWKESALLWCPRIGRSHRDKLFPDFLIWQLVSSPYLVQVSRVRKRFLGPGLSLQEEKPHWPRDNAFKCASRLGTNFSPNKLCPPARAASPNPPLLLLALLEAWP